MDSEYLSPNEQPPTAQIQVIQPDAPAPAGDAAAAPAGDAAAAPAGDAAAPPPADAAPAPEPEKSTKEKNIEAIGNIFLKILEKSLEKK